MGNNKDLKKRPGRFFGLLNDNDNWSLTEAFVTFALNHDSEQIIIYNRNSFHFLFLLLVRDSVL